MDVGTRGESPGVIWITGYPSSGKSTVARKVAQLLEHDGIQVILLDGDELRSMLAGRWGYAREDRTDLARVYFRFCNYLASQGVTVVIAAVAMFDEVRQWIRENITRPFEAYLEVPEAERWERASRQEKVVYREQGGLSNDYDEPTAADIVIENYGGTTVADAAKLIVDAYRLAQPSERVQHERASHWSTYYRENGGVFEPTEFAKAVNEQLGQSSRIVEVGCGNGRDALFLANNGHSVTALDTSRAAIDLCLGQHEASNVRFLQGHLPDVKADLVGTYDAIYSRFCFHAMTVTEERDVLTASLALLRPEGRLFVECRSMNDPLAREGEVISPNERIYGHYRRFISLDELIKRVVQTGFEIVEHVESSGLAVFGEEDPVIIRLVARRSASG